LANYSFRKAGNDDLVLLGEIGEYEPLSRAAYYKAMLKERVKDMDVDVEEVIQNKNDANA
jgi:thymidine kinase